MVEVHMAESAACVHVCLWYVCSNTKVMDIHSYICTFLYPSLSLFLCWSLLALPKDVFPFCLVLATPEPHSNLPLGKILHNSVSNFFVTDKTDLLTV